MKRVPAFRFAAASVTLLMFAAPLANAQKTIHADVVALDQAFYNNRLGTFQASGMIFALRGDVISSDPSDQTLQMGKVMLRPERRVRPLVLRLNAGDCMQIDFQNLLAPVASVAQGFGPPYPFEPQNLKTVPDPSGSANTQPATRLAGVHVMGMELKEIQSDGSWVGANPNSLVEPGEKTKYQFCAVAEGAYLMFSTAADVGGGRDGSGVNANGGQLSEGLFGAVTVQPSGAEWYRSQVTREDLDLATYRANELPANRLAPKMTGGSQETFTLDGKTYKVWNLKTGPAPGAPTVEVTQVSRAGDPVDQSGFLKTRDLHPIVNYQAVYPPGFARAGVPILAMLDKNLQIVHGDLTAVITGPNAGRFPKSIDPVFLPNPTYPNRDQPYREFAIHYHDDFAANQAFPEFSGRIAGVSYALEAARDFFAINYGMDAIGPEVWANRINVGPMHQCDTCKFEEFFLSSWAVGDPAMIVDIPANAQTGPATGPKSTKALYPDDPSNVYHSYMGDHVQFRILHAGTNITHVHHQHAHQWLHSPNSDDSDYRDSQMISPGGSYTLDMSYFGSGNLNQTVGDSIFHCHFYPHFAQGMWSMWRVHDVFEAGTVLDAAGRAVPDWNRALPDGEIAEGTPIPALVPLPTLAMAPMPVRTKICPVWEASDYVQFTGETCPAKPASAAKAVGYKALVSKLDITNRTEKNPGYPFFVPGVAGQRVTHPPLDFAPDEDSAGTQKVVNGVKQYLDGGLPRNQALKDQGTIYEQHNAWDFTKENDSLLAVQLDEEGTELEKAAMAAHATRTHPSITPEGNPGVFILNGQSPKHGAPFADPAVDVKGQAIPGSDCEKHEAGCVRYKAADIEMDVVLNKKGWHFPQQRMLSLWGDVKPNLDGTRRPEPLFFRANSEKVVEYWHTNLVPAYYELDDFQVRTPTDVLGQHIHLVKFDVTSSDGAGNGFNYEDGTYSPEEVTGLIKHINKNGGLFSIDGTTRNLLTAKEIPFFATTFPGKWPGAQATIQRWYADPIKNNAGQDRTLRTVFTHDHFGPSTHQQVGLYAGLVIEPKGSKWFDSTTGVELGGRADGDHDGGPTTYQANIILPDARKSYREFLLEFQDRQLAYLNTSITTPKPYERYGPGQARPNPGGFWGWADPTNAVNPPAGPLDLIPGGPPTPHLVTNQFQEGAYSLNYFNEPLVPRLGGTGQQNNLAYVFRSMQRNDPSVNCQPKMGWPINPPPNCQAPQGPVGGFKYPPPQEGAEKFDPYTPLLRAYEGDNVQIRNLVGAHMGPHAYHIHGLNWQFEPSLDSSGFRSTQGMGLSEHYELLFRLPVTKLPQSADYLYIPTSDSLGLQYGNWGLIRGYKSSQNNLVALSDSQAKAFPGGAHIPAAGSAPPTCAPNARARKFQVTAVSAQNVLGGPLVYNARGAVGTPGLNKLEDANALMYVLTSDLENCGTDLRGCTLKKTVPREPLILRAAAGDCITVELTNALFGNLNNGLAAASPWGDTTLQTSHDVGLHPQLVSYDIATSDGFNIGNNPVSTLPASPPGVAAPKVTYTWYAGRVTSTAQGKVYTPVEFGAIGLAPSDPIMQHKYGLIGALVIEPQGSKWATDDNSRAAATVTKADKTSFREAVAVVLDDLASDQVSVGLNYRSEPFAYRYKDPEYLDTKADLSTKGVSRSQSDTLVAADPQTPVFPAEAGKPLRMRMVHPAGLNEQVFELHGHTWQEEPYSKGSARIVDNNKFSQWTGSRDAFGPNASFDVVLKRAGGKSAVQGDYMFRTFIRNDFLTGMWGVVRVGPPGKDVVTLTTFCSSPEHFTVEGVNTVNPVNHHMAATVTISGTDTPETVEVDRMTGHWIFQSGPIASAPASITVKSAQGGTVTANAPLCPIIQNQGPASPRSVQGNPETDRFRPTPPKSK